MNIQVWQVGRGGNTSEVIIAKFELRSDAELFVDAVMAESNSKFVGFEIRKED